MEILLFAIVAGVVWGFWKRKKDQEKTCPRCGETIQKGAAVCRFCHAELIPKREGA